MKLDSSGNGTGNGASSHGANGSAFFRRREEKYELLAAVATFLRGEIERHLPSFEFRKGFLHTYITTIYFDTNRLDLYQQARAFFDDNLKIRVKEYYYDQATTPGMAARFPADSPERWLTVGYCFVEIKQRIQGLVVKRRFELPKNLLGRLLCGDDVWHALVDSRKGIEFNETFDIYGEFRRYLQQYKVFPKSVINYRRSVFQEDEHELRVTFDDEIAVYQPPAGLYDRTESLTPATMGKPTRSIPSVIMEIKSRDRYPAWLQSLLETHSPQRLSKFTTSLNILTQELPQPDSPSVGGGGALGDDSGTRTRIPDSEILRAENRLRPTERPLQRKAKGDESDTTEVAEINP